MFWLPLLAALAVGLLVAVCVVAGLIASYWDSEAHRPPVAPPQVDPEDQPKVARISVRRLRVGDQVVTPSSPYRYRVEQVAWIEHRRFGPVVAALEFPDPETFQPQVRWHLWPEGEMVQVFVGDVELADYSGSYEDLYKQFTQPQQQPKPKPEEQPQQEENPGPSTSELALPWERVQ